MIDSCIHFKNNGINYIYKISKALKKRKIKKALCIFDNEKSIAKRMEFMKNCKKYDNLEPVALIRSNANIKSEFKNIVRLKYKFVKIHPRILKIRLENIKFYVKVFQEIKKTKLKVLWCTFDGWEKKANEKNQLELLSKLINIIPKNKIILMHGGGPNLLKYYEKFRFLQNVFIDLSYTLIQYKNTSLEKDIIFLMKKFDKRLTVGCDYPTFNLSKYLIILKRIIIKSKINKNKIDNILHNNLKKMINA